MIDIRRALSAVRILLAILLTGSVLYACTALPKGQPVFTLPGAQPAQRTLLRIWVTSAPGGGMAWLRNRLAAFEKYMPGLLTYVRQVTPEECLAAETLPDVILHMPGDFTAPADVMQPITGALKAGEALLWAGRWQGLQYGLPLCWSAWVLAINSEYDQVPAATPAPSTLIGMPAATQAPAATATPAFPLEKLRAASSPLGAPKCAGLFLLAALLGDSSSSMADGSILMASSADVYAAFRNRRVGSALLTTGQLTAFDSLQRAGRGFPIRVMTADSVVTDQVWLAGVCHAGSEARTLLAFLISDESQIALRSQGLYSVQPERALYATGVAAQVEDAARRSMTAINGYVLRDEVMQRAWQAFVSPATAEEVLNGLT